MGSKARYAKYIVPILQETINKNNVTTYIEPFVGGANIIDKIKCKNRFGYDRSDTLIALLDQASKDWNKVLKENSREIWDKGKAYVKDGIISEDVSLADIGAMEFFASFSAGGFKKGYAKNVPGRNYFDEAYRNMEKQAPQLKGIIFKCQNYWELEPVSNAVIYLDPPYENTMTYGYANQSKMDYTKFWDWVRNIASNNYVFISEQKAPDDFEVLWKKEIKRTLGIYNDCRATEKLFRYKDGLK